METILFLCVANSARSQMAEALAKTHFKNQFRFISAGSAPTQVNPLAIEAMKEKGIDISQKESTDVQKVDSDEVSYVITLCQDEVCPAFLGKAKKLHWPFPDPHTSEDFKKIRDLIEEKLQQELPKIKEAHS